MKKTYELKDLVSPKEENDDVIKFPPSPLGNMDLKTVYIVRRKILSYGMKKNSLDEFYLELHQCPYAESTSCPLYNKHGARRFLVIHFDKRCPAKVMSDFLNKGLKVCEKINGQYNVRIYNFFGHSPSQLRECTCVLYNYNELGDFRCIVNAFGRFDNLKTVSKKAARIGLLLSASKPVVTLTKEEIQRVGDVERNSHTFTDGCGFISVYLAKQILEKLEITEKYSYLRLGVPSAFQVRLLGCKGMLMLDPTLEAGVKIRPSMEKFQWNYDIDSGPYNLGVVDNGLGMSRPNCYGVLNKQYICLLSALGVHDDVLLGKQENHFQDLSRLTSDRDLQIRYLCASERFNLAERLIADPNSASTDVEVKKELLRIRRKGIEAPNYGNTNKLLKKKKSPALGLKIPIEKSRNIYGVCDPSGKLKYGTCFLQPTIGGVPKVLSDMEVVVCKNPCYYKGDVRVLTCVDIPECHHLVDVVVFPVQGDRPHADEIAGSDLDGDKFFVCWDVDLIPPRRAEPTGYPAAEISPKSEITKEDLIKYFCETDNHTVPKLSRLFDKWLDIRGIDSNECEMIANLFNVAIDSAKTGKTVEIPSALLSPPKEKGKGFVWTKMTSRAQTFLDDDVKKWSDHFESDLIFSESDMGDFLQDTDACTSEYQKFRFLFRWWSSAASGDINKLLKNIDFTRMIRMQRKRAAVDLGVKGIDSGVVFNDLHRSEILAPEDIKKLEGDIHEVYAWQLHARMSRDNFSWNIFNECLSTDGHKLVVFKILMRGEEWVVAVSMAVELKLRDTVRVEDKAKIPVKMFAAVHNKEGTHNVSTDLVDGYEISLDGERMQIFKNVRTDTFLCMMNLNDEMLGMSIAMNKYRAGFQQSQNNVKLMREDVIEVEIFFRHASPHMSSGLLYERNVQDEPEANPTRNPDTPAYCVPNDYELQFPKLEESLKRFITAEEKVNQLSKELLTKEKGKVTIVDLGRLQRLFKTEPEVKGQCADVMEQLLWQHDLHLQCSSEYKDILTTLLDSCPSTAKIERLCDGMAKWKEGFTAKQLSEILQHLIFASSCDKLVALELLQLLHVGIVPLHNNAFRNGCKKYHYHWTSLITMEIVEEIRQIKLSAVTSDKYVLCGVFISEEVGSANVDVHINIEGSRQPFKLTDGIALTLVQDDKMVYDPTYFVAVEDITGMIVKANLVWPKEDIGSLKSLLSKDSSRVKWRADAFPNLVTYHRMLSALDKICLVQSELLEDISLVAEILPAIVKSFHDNEERSEPVAQMVTQDVEAEHSGSSLLHSDLETDSASNTLGLENLRLPRSVLERMSGGSRTESSSSVDGIRGKYKVNESQAEAILAAMTDAISLIQGPPGTGKTHTAAIIVKEWAESAKSPVLVVAETNEGVKNLVRKLISLGVSSNDIIRLASGEEKSKPELEEFLLEKRCSDKRGNVRRCKAEKIIKKCKVLCATCIASGSALLNDIQFRHVLVDEAVQAIEPAILVAVAHGARKICLIGDDMQLPPFSRCKQAAGLKVSLFERLRSEEYPVYLLDTQYRMHPLISAFPSKMWYKSKLRDGVTAEDRPLPLRFDWPGQKPVAFVNMPKNEERSKGSSKFNQSEVDRVVSDVETLLSGGLEESAIGVISPYKAQVSKIVDALRTKGIANVNIRTVDGFQGQERDVIIFSTVRSNDYGQLGFIDDSRRMNVALTRAKRGLIVLGNAETLGTDDTWKRWIEWVRHEKVEISDERPCTSSWRGQGHHRKSANRGRGRGRVNSGAGSQQPPGETGYHRGNGGRGRRNWRERHK